MRKIVIPVMGLLLFASACSLPNFAPAATQTPSVYVTVLVATPTPDAAVTIAKVTPTLSTPAPTAMLTATATLSVTLTPTTTVTLTPTAIPAGPTGTPTLAPMGDPLAFGDPAWELVVWHAIEDTNDWEGTIRLHIVGGVAPYRFQIEDNPISDTNEVVIRWRICKPMPATARVWSADGQIASTAIWVWELGCQN